MKEIKVSLSGLEEIILDRYDNANLRWHEKIDVIPGTNTVCLPSLEIMMYVRNERINKKYKKIKKHYFSYVEIVDEEGNCGMAGRLPFFRNGKEITVGIFGEKEDELSGLYKIGSFEKFKVGGNWKYRERAVLPCPWEISFKIRLYDEKYVSEEELRKIFEKGKRKYGLGKGGRGQFEIKSWE